MALHHNDTVKGTEVVHSVRNRQSEYDSAKGRNVPRGETHCGRHYTVTSKKKGADVTCKTCVRALL